MKNLRVLILLIVLVSLFLPVVTSKSMIFRPPKVDDPYLFLDIAKESSNDLQQILNSYKLKHVEGICLNEYCNNAELDVILSHKVDLTDLYIWLKISIYGNKATVNLNSIELSNIINQIEDISLVREFVSLYGSKAIIERKNDGILVRYEPSLSCSDVKECLRNHCISKPCLHISNIKDRENYDYWIQTEFDSSIITVEIQKLKEFQTFHKLKHTNPYNSVLFGLKCENNPKTLSRSLCDPDTPIIISKDYCKFDTYVQGPWHSEYTFLFDQKKVLGLNHGKFSFLEEMTNEEILELNWILNIDFVKNYKALHPDGIISFNKNDELNLFPKEYPRDLYKDVFRLELDCSNKNNPIKDIIDFQENKKKSDWKNVWMTFVASLVFSSVTFFVIKKIKNKNAKISLVSTLIGLLWWVVILTTPLAYSADVASIPLYLLFLTTFIFSIRGIISYKRNPRSGGKVISWILFLLTSVTIAILIILILIFIILHIINPPYI